MKTQSLRLETLPPSPRKKSRARQIEDSMHNCYCDLMGWIGSEKNRPLQRGKHLTLILPMTTNLANDSLHYRVKQKLKAQYQSNCEEMLRLKLLPVPPVTPPPLVRARIKMWLRQASDRDNRTARLKWPLDFLTNHGYIVDDRDENLFIEGYPEQFCSRKAGFVPRIQIELEWD